MSNPDLLHRLSQENAQLSEQMQEIRAKYKESANAYYKTLDTQGQLFPQGREDCKPNVLDDIRQYDRLIADCLQAGDTELLKTWGIAPIFSHSSGENRLASQNLESYIESWTDYINESQHDFEKICWIVLRDTFQSELDKKKV